MKICFLMYKWSHISPETDTTLRLIHEATQRGHTVAVLTPGGLTIRENEVYGFCNVLDKNRISDKIPVFYRNVQFQKTKLPMGGFDCIFMRINPPLNTMALNFLDPIKGDVFIINDLDGLRVASNKLYTNSFVGPAAKYLPVTHISKNKEYLMGVLEDSKTDRMVLKPLDGFGGQGVIVIEKEAKENFNSLLDYYLGKNNTGTYVILQEFVTGAEKGDIRILMLNGEPIGAMRRVPKQGELRSNIHVGGKAEKYVLTKRDKELCRAIGPRLVRDGLFFVGIDVIENKLIEVNVLSPGGITRINRLNRTRLQAKVLDFIEAVVDSREFLVQRRFTFRQVIDAAGKVKVTDSETY